MAKPRRNRRSSLSAAALPRGGNQWTFKAPAVAEAFDAHVREQLPWYDVATGVVRHVARHFVPEGGLVVDVGASTGNVGRAIAPVLEARGAHLVAIDNAEDMGAVYAGPGRFVVADAETFDFKSPAGDGEGPDLVVCFLSLMFVPVHARRALVERIAGSVRPGGAVLVFDKMLPPRGYVGAVTFRLALAAKYENGAPPDQVVAKELSLAGVQRPMSEDELPGFVEIFRFGDFAGWLREVPA